MLPSVWPKIVYGTPTPNTSMWGYTICRIKYRLENFKSFECHLQATLQIFLQSHSAIWLSNAYTPTLDFAPQAKMALLIEEENLNMLPISGEEEHLTLLSSSVFCFLSFFLFSWTFLWYAPSSCICTIHPRGQRILSLWYYIATPIWYQGGVLECVITSWLWYHTMYAHDWGLHCIACAHSPPFPLSSNILQWLRGKLTTILPHLQHTDCT